MDREPLLQARNVRVLHDLSFKEELTTGPVLAVDDAWPQCMQVRWSTKAEPPQGAAMKPAGRTPSTTRAQLLLIGTQIHRLRFTQGCICMAV